MSASANPSRRRWLRPRDSGADDQDIDGGATEPGLDALAAELATASSGVSFIYRALERLGHAGGWDDVVLVLEEPSVGRQVFRSRRRPPWEAPLDLRDAEPGVYADGRPVDPSTAATTLPLCAVALRMDLLRHDASHDALTGLLNRRSFDELLIQSASRSVRYGWPFALVLIDIDHFKALNDRLGHDGGDRMLRAVGAELRQSLRAGDVAARLGGDEFALILAKGDGDLVSALLRRLEAAVREALEGEEMGFSAGLALAPV
ncbi:MAG TPA: GGDEF domain-containing protein, partial [Acidimicrobiales bacterium]